MTGLEALIHAAAIETTRDIEGVVAFPRSKRALVFFEVFRRIKKALENLCTEDHLKPGPN